MFAIFIEVLPLPRTLTRAELQRVSDVTAYGADMGESLGPGLGATPCVGGCADLVAFTLLAGATPCLCHFWESELISASSQRQHVDTSSSQGLGSINVIKVHGPLIVEYGSISWHAMVELWLLSLEHVPKEIIAFVSTLVDYLRSAFIQLFSQKNI